MLRHTCLTRLGEAGMALEAVQARAGHRSIESTRIYLHLSNGWLAEEYHHAIEALEQETGRLDRLLHHAHVCQTTGESVRLSQALAGQGVSPLT